MKPFTKTQTKFKIPKDLWKKGDKRLVVKKKPGRIVKYQY